MTDRAKGLYVALERDIRTDDVEPLIEAIKCMRGVADVTCKISNSDDWMARSRLATQWQETLWDVFSALRDGRSVTIEKKSDRD